MIELKVEMYCHECPDFEADVSSRTESIDVGYNTFLGEFETKKVHSTTVRCAHAARCRAVKRYLEKQQKGE